MSAVTEYLCCCRLLRKDAECLFKTIANLSQLLRLDMKERMATFCADGDRAMHGLRNGLGGCLRRHLQTFIGTHCAAHKQVLAVQTAAQGNRMIKDIDQLLQTLYALFNRKAKQVALGAVCCQTRSESLQFPDVREDTLVQPSSMHPAHHLKFPSACPVLAGCDHSRVVNVLGQC
jgi:hypothetical protein